MGPRAGLRRDRRRRHRPRRRRSAAARMARRGASRHDGLYGTARRAPRASGRARPGDGVSHHRADRLHTAARASERGGAGRSGEGVHRALRARARLSQGAAREALPSCRAHRGGDRSIRLSRVHRQRAGARGRARREVGYRLAREAHAAAHARGWLVVLPGRALHRPCAAADRAPDSRTAARAPSASTSARRGRSSRPTSSTRAAASRI